MLRPAASWRPRGLGCAGLALAFGPLAPACKPAPPAIVEIVPAAPGAWLPESLELELGPSKKRVDWKRGAQVVINDLATDVTLAPTGGAWLGQPARMAPGKIVELRLLPLSPLDSELRPSAWRPGTSTAVLFVDLSGASEIKLSWRDGLLVTERARSGPSPAELEAAAGKEWKLRGHHKLFGDSRHDIAVLLVGPHARLADVEPFATAISRVQRSVGDAWGPAFDLTVARASELVRSKPTRGPTREELERVPEPAAVLPTDGLRVSGRIVPRVVLDALQSRARAMAACASREQGRTVELELNIVFGADGVVGKATVHQEGVESESAACVADALREAPFPEPEGGKVTLSGKLRLDPSGSPGRQPAPPFTLAALARSVGSSIAVRSAARPCMGCPMQIYFVPMHAIPSLEEIIGLLLGRPRYPRYQHGVAHRNPDTETLLPRVDYLVGRPAVPDRGARARLRRERRVGARCAVGSGRRSAAEHREPGARGRGSRA